MGRPPKDKLVRAYMGVLSAGGSEVMWRHGEKRGYYDHHGPSRKLKAQAKTARWEGLIAERQRAAGRFQPGAGTRLLR